MGADALANQTLSHAALREYFHVISHSMKRFFKRHWSETTGEPLTDSWGNSTFYFQTNQELVVFRQIQVFEYKQVLKYDLDFRDDKYGMLTDQNLELEDFKEFEISENEFTSIWDSLKRNVI